MRMRNTLGWRSRLGAVVPLAALMTGMGVHAKAQSVASPPLAASPAQPQPASDAKPHAVAKAPTEPPAQQEVMVTAQRRPQRNKDVPISVSRLDASTVQTIETSGGDLRALAARVPSLNIESSFGRTFPRLYIRGLGNPDFDITAAQPVGVYYDDVVLENPLLKSFPIFDIQDVEVLAGPQGTLFGRNTPAGVLKISSNRPTDTFGGSFDQSYATYNTVVSTAVVNAPIIPGKLDVRVSIINQHRDDWVHNNYSGGYDWRKNLEGYNDIAGRFQAMYHFDDSFTLLFEAEVRHLEGTATLFRANIIQKGSNGLVPGFDPAQVGTNGDNYQNVNTRGGHVTLHKDLGGYGIDFISAYEHGAIKSRGDIDGGYAPLVPFDVETATVTPAVDQFTEELRLSANNWGRLFNQAGVYYFHEYIDNYDQNFSPVGQLTTQANERQSTESVGVFDSASYRLTDRLKIEAGVRYTADFRTFDAVRQFGGAGFLSLGTKANAANISWDANATYALTSGINAYFRAATGYLEPSVQGRITDESYLSKAAAETTTSYEIGLKGAMLHRRAIFTADAYMWDNKNLQLTASGGTQNITELVNARKAIGRGLEAQLDLLPIAHLNLSGNASYNYTEIQDPNLETAYCGDGCTVLNPIDPNHKGQAFINGNPLPNAPRFILNGTARYAIPLQADDEIFLSTDWSWRSGVDFGLYKAAEFDGKPLLLGGAAIGYKNYAKHYQVDVFVRNILNRIVTVGDIDFDNLEGYINDPRIIGAEGHVSF